MIISLLGSRIVGIQIILKRYGVDTRNKLSFLNKTSKRGKSLSIDLRSDLKTLITHILKDIDYDSLSNTQKLKLLDIALKHTLPKLSIEKQITVKEPPREFQINIIGDKGEVLETHNNVLDENFNFSNMAGGNSSK